MIIAGVYVYYSQHGKLSAEAYQNVKFRVIDLHKNENAIREKPSSTDENSDKTLRSVESLMSVQSSDAGTQNSGDPPSPFPDGPVGSVSEEPLKNGKITKSIQCGGNCVV
uniref:Uncharacterized protein n=1 Tax=Panagrolaimus sp. ES5 TaxID=591445 RepID=A0AC34FFX5_9BILA